MSRRRVRKSVISQRHGDNFMNSRPLSLTQRRKYHCSPIKPNLRQMSMSVSCLQARDKLIKKHIKLMILFCASWNSWDQSDDAQWGKNDGRTRWTQVLWMEAVVLAIPLVLRVTWPLARHTCPGEISGSFYGDRVSSSSARGGGRRECWSCADCVLLFLNVAEMKWRPGSDFHSWNVKYKSNIWIKLPQMLSFIFSGGYCSWLKIISTSDNISLQLKWAYQGSTAVFKDEAIWFNSIFMSPISCLQFLTVSRVHKYKYIDIYFYFL